MYKHLNMRYWFMLNPNDKADVHHHHLDEYLQPILTMSMLGSAQTSESGIWSAPCPQYMATFVLAAPLKAAEAAEARRPAAKAARVKMDGYMITVLAG